MSKYSLLQENSSYIIKENKTNQRILAADRKQVAETVLKNLSSGKYGFNGNTPNFLVRGLNSDK